MKDIQILEGIKFQYMNVKTISTYLGVARSTIYKWTESGFIPHKKLGKHIVFVKEHIDEWVLNNGMILDELPEVPKSLLIAKDHPEVKNINVPEIELKSERQHMIIKYRPAV